MKTIHTFVLAAALTIGLSACITTTDDAGNDTSQIDPGFWLSVAAIGGDLGNDAGVLIAQAGNISEAGMQQILYASNRVTGSLERCFGILENARAGLDTTFNVTGCAVETVNALEALVDLTKVEGSPFSGQSTAQVIGSLFAMTYPEAAALSEAYEAAQDAGVPLPTEVVAEFVLNAVGSNARLKAAIEAQTE